MKVTEREAQPLSERKSNIINGKYLTFVAYPHDEDSFYHRYQQEHVPITEDAFGRELREEMGGLTYTQIAVHLDGIGMRKINQPDFYISSKGVGYQIKTLAYGIWSFQKGMTEKEIYQATNAVFGTYAGKRIIQNAITFGMVVPPPRGMSWDFPIESEKVLEISFVGDNLQFPSVEDICNSPIQTKG